MSQADDIAIAIALADAAGAAIRPFFRAPYEIDTKADQGRRLASDRGRQGGRRGHARYHRERGAGRRDHRRGIWRDAARGGAAWVLDPIDGTRSFIAGRPIFRHADRAHAGRLALIGIIDQPISGERWIGVVGQPTRLTASR